MSAVQVIEGTLQPDGTLVLNEKPSLPPGSVRVTIEARELKPTSGPGWWEVLQQIWKDQEARGYQPPTPEEMESWIAELRDDEEYEERWRRIWAQTEHTPPSEEKS